MEEDMADLNKLEIGLVQGSKGGTLHLIRSLRLDILYHLFADDNQLYTSLHPNPLTSQESATAIIEHFINALSAWLRNNQLKLNENMIELVLIGKKTQISKMTYNSITIVGQEIQATQCAKNLGIFIYQELSLRQQVNHVVKSCNIQLRILWSTRTYLDIAALVDLFANIILE